MLLHFFGIRCYYINPLDSKLLESGKSLDNLLEYLYVNFGLEGKKYTQNDVVSALQEITGKSFEDLFNTHLHNNSSLESELNGKFPFLKHPLD